MATKKPPAPTGKVATKRAAARKRAASSTAGMATARSLKVANELAAGTRVIPPESLVELPANVTPLDVMVMAMRRAYLIGGSIAAAPYAEKAAPYVHAKISSIELKNPVAGAGGGKPTPFQIEFVDPEDKPE